MTEEPERRPIRKGSALRAKNFSSLNPIEEKFCHEYIKDYDVKAAIGRAVPEHANDIENKKYKFRFMNNPAIHARIRELQLELRKEAKITVTDVLRKLESAYAGAMDAEQYGAAIRAAELLGKHIGMFVEKQLHIVQIAGINGSPDEQVAHADIKKLLGVLGEAAPETYSDNPLQIDIKPEL